VLLLSVIPLIAQTPQAAQTPAPDAARRVAVTIDDAPVVNELSDVGNYRRITAGLIGAFVSDRVPVTVFINERQLNVPGQRDARAAALDQWLDAGFDLGNHGYEHLSANNTPLQQFTDDVLRGEVITRAALEARGRKLAWFRYPYLHSGTTAEAHQAIVDFLETRAYRVAPVTVDYADYTFASAYQREIRAGRADQAARIRQAYVDQADVGFEYAEKASVEVFGREIPQILLIHCNELNSVALRDSFARMRARGYRFITLEEAMADQAYARPDTFTGPGGSWLSRSAAWMGKKIQALPPRVPAWVTEAPQTTN
jgi:peptidoglycan/xylan/chitin deacetylase (PgdA/CDA1 family)